MVVNVLESDENEPSCDRYFATGGCFVWWVGARDGVKVLTATHALELIVFYQIYPDLASTCGDGRER
jgi:hypothetical protein